MRCVGVVHIWPRQNCRGINAEIPKGQDWDAKRNKDSLFWTMHVPGKAFLEASIRIMHSAWLRNLLKPPTKPPHTCPWEG